jgi:hypothetical protein
VFLRISESKRFASNPMRLGLRQCKQGRAGRGGLEMRSKTRHVRAEDSRRAGNEQVRREIQSFLRALHSYPDRFVKDPSISFEEHRRGFGRAASAATRRRF